METRTETSPLKTLLNSPLRNVPAVPTPDWSTPNNMGPPPVPKSGPQSVMSAITPVLNNDPHSSVTLQNCVATVNLGCELNLKMINFRTRNSEYNPARFHGVIMRIREPRTTALVFKSGKIVCTGARSEEDALLASKKFARIIQKLGFNVCAVGGGYAITKTLGSCRPRDCSQTKRSSRCKQVPWDGATRKIVSGVTSERFGGVHDSDWSGGPVIDITMWMWSVLVVGMAVATCASYMSAGKEHFLSDALLREVVDRMGKDLAEAADAYLDLTDGGREAIMRPRPVHKDLDTEEQMFPIDYDSLADTGPNPSIRDQEYLEHSSLWGNQYVSGGAGEGHQRLRPEGSMKNRQEVKTDATLPAYCNPPNPCPVGYEEDQGCTNNMEFENTAAYSRQYQASQDCMCDTEHMFECPGQDEQHNADGLSDNMADVDFNRFLQHTFKTNDQNAHKNLVAKKFHTGKDYYQNPFLVGERLPVAAKKGTHVVY